MDSASAFSLDSNFNSPGMHPPREIELLSPRLSAPVDHQLDWLADMRMVPSPCPCGLAGDDVVLAQVERYGLPLDSVMCLACGTVRIDPYLDPASIERFYRDIYQTFYARADSRPEYFTAQHSYGQKVYTIFAEQLPPGGDVLEIGCGAGGALDVFTQRGFRTAGCDYSERLIQHGTANGVQGLWTGSLAEMPERERRFDLIYSHHVMEHVDTPIDMLTELGSLLKPGGKILSVVPDISHIDLFPNPGGDVLQFLHIAHKYNYSWPGTRLMARQAGLRAEPVINHQRMQTQWSELPEMWIEFTPLVGDPADAVIPTPASAGREMLTYLRKVERQYRWGLCPVQVRQKLWKYSGLRTAARLKRSIAKRLPGRGKAEVSSTP